MHAATIGDEVGTMRTARGRAATVGRPTTGDFGAFFAAQERDLLRFCWGLTLDREVARDVAQEAMARAWRDWDRIAVGNPTGWVRTVALNLVRNRWRADRRGDAAVARLQVVVGDGTIEDGPPMSDEVRSALAALSDRQREAIVLHHLLDLPVAQVAELMEIGEPATKTHLQRGRAALAHLLVDDHIDEPDDGGADHG